VATVVSIQKGCLSWLIQPDLAISIHLQAADIGLCQKQVAQGPLPNLVLVCNGVISASLALVVAFEGLLHSLVPW